MENQIKSYQIVIQEDNGPMYWFKIIDGKLHTGGDLPLTKAAEIFIKELKRIAAERK